MWQCHKHADTLNMTAIIEKQFNFIPLFLFNRVLIAKVQPIINVIYITNAFNLNNLADGQKANSSRSAGMSAPAMRARARQRAEEALQYRPNALNFGEAEIRVSSHELLNLNSRCGGGYADLP